MSVAFGIDFSASKSVIVRAVGRGRRVRFEALPALPEQVECAAALPTYECFARRIVAPLASAEKARKVLPSLLDVQLPFPIEKCVSLFPEVIAAGAHSDALAVVARVEEVEAALGRLQEQRVDATRLDHEALALWARLCDEVPPRENEIRAVAYLGLDRCALVVGRGARFLGATGSRSPSVDHQRWSSFLRAQLGADADAPFTWALVGPGVAVDSQRALRRPEGTTFLNVNAPDQFLARALAARAISDATLPCNFRSGPLEHPSVRARESRAARLASTACVAASIALIALCGAWRMYLATRDERLQTRLAQVAAEVTGMAKVPHGQELVVARRVRDEGRSRASAFERPFAPSVALSLAKLLSIAQELGIEVSTLNWSDDQMEFSGAALSRESLEPLSEKLALAGWGARPEQGDPLPDGRVAVRVKAVKL